MNSKVDLRIDRSEDGPVEQELLARYSFTVVLSLSRTRGNNAPRKVRRMGESTYNLTHDGGCL